MSAEKQAAGEKPAKLPIDVLIIDDEQAFAETSTRILEKGGYRVEIAKSGSQGMQIVGSEHPSVVLLDLALAGISGIEVLDRLVKTEPFAVPIVVTGQGTVDSAVEAMKLGAFDVLTKPCPPEKLLETVRRALGLSVLRKEAKGTQAAAAQPHPSDKYDLLLQGLDVLGEAYSLGLEKRQLLDELTYLENEAKYHAESLGQIKKKERAILDIRDELLKVDAVLHGAGHRHWGLLFERAFTSRTARRARARRPRNDRCPGNVPLAAAPHPKLDLGQAEHSVTRNIRRCKFL